MRTKILLLVVVLGIMTGCGKNNFTTRPQLTYKKVNTNQLGRNQVLRFTLEVTDAEGDLQDSIWVEEVVRNCVDAGFVAKYAMPPIAATKDLKGEIEICFGYGTNLGCPIIQPTCTGNRNDSATFRFWIQDKAKNVSDTIRSEEIVILQQ